MMTIAFTKDEHTLVVFYNSNVENQTELINKLKNIQEENKNAIHATVIHDIQTQRGKMLYEMHHKGEKLPIAYFSKWVTGERVNFDFGQVNSRQI